MANQRIQDKDGDWLRQSFMVPRTHISVIDQRSQLYGEARFKYTDTALGGNFAINPPPQFTRYADLRVSGRLTRNQGHDGKGLGRYYSEAIDDNSQLIHLRFGVPEFNSLSTFFTGFYNADASLLVRTGRSPGAFYTLGRVAGFVVAIPFAPFIAAGYVWRYIAQYPASKFYYLKPQMVPYWSTVNSIVNTLAVNMGIIPRVWGDEQAKVYAGAGESPTDGLPGPNDIARLNNIFADIAPDIFEKDGGIDIYKVANRATRLMVKHQERMREIFESSPSNEELQRKVKAYLSESIAEDKGTGINGAIKRYSESIAGVVDAEKQADAVTAEKTSRGVVDSLSNFIVGTASELAEYGEAEFKDGSAFVTFRVDHTGTVQESFSNTTRESDLASKINSTSSSAREARFNFAEGNFGDGVFNAAEAVAGAAKDLVVGAIDQINMSGLATLAGSAFVDIPEHWDQSVTNLPSKTYNIQLRTPYGNKLAIFQNLYVPLSMLIAGALPRSTGTHSYNSPFLVELYDKGRAQTRLGIIDSMTITRGVGNVGWSVDQLPLGIDVSFSVKDLSTIMHMPIGPNFSFDPTKNIFDEDNAFNDYLAVLGSLGLSDQIYFLRRLNLSLSRKMVSYRQWTSPAKYANVANGLLPGRLVNAIAREIERPN